MLFRQVCFEFRGRSKSSDLRKTAARSLINLNPHYSIMNVWESYNLKCMSDLPSNPSASRYLSVSGTPSGTVVSFSLCFMLYLQPYLFWQRTQPQLHTKTIYMLERSKTELCLAVLKQKVCGYLDQHWAIQFLWGSQMCLHQWPYTNV